MMRKLILIIAIFGSTFGTAWGQQAPFQDSTKTAAALKIEELITKKQTVRAEEKAKLKAEVKAIYDRVDSGEISLAEAEQLKQDAAKKRALNIEDKLDLLAANIDLIKRNQDSTDHTEAYINVGRLLTRKAIPIDSIPRLTIGGWGVSFGYATLSGKSGAGDSFKGGLSIDVFLRLNTVLTRENPRWRLDYGVAFSTHFFDIKDNKTLVGKDNVSQLKQFPLHLNHSNFTMANLVFPFHLEYGKAPVKYEDKQAYYDRRGHFSIGLGGFLGVKLSSVATYEYDDQGRFDEVTHHRNFNTNNFLYGLSVYVNYRDIRLFARYSLNPMFKSAAFNGRVMVVGMNIDLTIFQPSL